MVEKAGREVSYLLLKREADSKTVVRKLHSGISAKKQVAEILSSPFLPQHHLDHFGTPVQGDTWPLHATSAAPLSGLGPHTGAVLQHLTSHCVSPRSILCSDISPSALVSPPCCRWEPRSGDGVLSACGCCGRVHTALPSCCGAVHTDLVTLLGSSVL